MNTPRLSLALAVLALASNALAHDGDPKLLWRQPAYVGPGYRNAQKQLVPGGGPSSNLTIAAQFPHQNTTLLAWLPLSDFGLGAGSNGNSCFGYTSPSGREYALFGHSSGTAIIEVTHPGNPVIVAQIAGPNSLWRDMRVFSHYCYAISEGSGGIQVIDLANVDSGTATLVNTVTTGGDGRTHTIAINTDSGYLYRAGGASNGLRIYDLNTDPSNPTFVGQWTDRYVHECQVVTYPTGGPGGGPREIAICCGGLNNGYTDTGIDLVDVTNHASPVSIGHFTYAQSGYSHQAWLSPDRTKLYHDDEIDNRPYTRVFDATNIDSASPTLPFLGEFQNSTTVDHNLYTKDTRIFQADYRSGLRVFDTTSGILTPTLVAYFDTYPADDLTGYNGMWNVYPYFASGTVVMSDIERGFFAVWVGAPQIAFEFPNGLPATIAPTGDSFVVRVVQNTPGVLQAGSPALAWSTGGSWTSTPLVPIGGDLYRAVFPALACGSTVHYSFAATGANGVVWTDPEAAPDVSYQTIVGFSSSTLASYDFESAAGWTSGASGDNASPSGVWVRLDPVGTAAQPEDDHTSGAGTRCWVTGQGVAGGAVGANDVDGGRTTLLSPVWDFSGAISPRIGYWRWFSNDQGGASTIDDAFQVDVTSNGTTWTNVETVGPTGADTHGGWVHHEFAVSDFTALTSQVRVRFVAQDIGVDSVVEAAIDDVTVTDSVCTGVASVCAGDGTGTACPCANSGALGHGCASSANAAGALLSASGTPSIASDTFVLDASSAPAATTVLFLQGTSTLNGGLGATFGDGLRCAGGSVVRLGTKLSAAGAASYPSGADLPISVRGASSAGATRFYQAYYRNAASFCTSETFNLTNGLAVVWSG